jgi:hypothetical protein
MEIENGHSRTAASISKISILILASFLVGACKGATISSDSLGRSDVRLSFRVLGGDNESKGGAASSISRLILPTASTLTVSLTPLAEGLSNPAPVTLPIASTSGASTLTASFTDIDPGRYKAQAEAKSESGDAKFLGSIEMDAAEGSVNEEIFLLPTASDYIGVANYSFTASASEGRTYVIEVPASVITVVNNGEIPAGSYGIELKVQSGPGVFEYFSLDVDGAIMSKGTFNTDAISNNGETASQITVTPSSSLKPTYLVIYNSSSNSTDDYFHLFLAKSL